MPPYFHDCVTYYSPAASMWQILYAFGAGLIAATISNYITEKQDPIVEPEEMNAEQLREELKLTRDQRTRAFHVIAFLLVGLWLCVVYLALKHGIGHSPYNLSEKTEL